MELNPCDIVITLPLQYKDRLQIPLPLWFDYIFKYNRYWNSRKKNEYIVQPKIISYTNRSFRKTALNTLKKVMNVSTPLKSGKDTLVIQYKLDPSATLNLETNVIIIGYTPCDKPVLMKWKKEYNYFNQYLPHTIWFRSI